MRDTQHRIRPKQLPEPFQLPCPFQSLRDPAFTGRPCVLLSTKWRCGGCLILEEKTRPQQAAMPPVVIESCDRIHNTFHGAIQAKESRADLHGEDVGLTIAHIRQ